MKKLLIHVNINCVVIDQLFIKRFTFDKYYKNLNVVNGSVTHWK